MKLSLRTQKLAIGALAGACLVGSVATVIWTVRAPHFVNIAKSEPAATDHGKLAALPNEITAPARDAFAKLCDIPLRRPLYDPPPPKQEVRQLPPLQIELLGTILEADNSMAIVRSAQGNVEYKRLGDSIGPVDSPANIVEIQGNAIVLQRSDEKITVAVRSQDGRR